VGKNPCDDAINESLGNIRVAASWAGAPTSPDGVTFLLSCIEIATDDLRCCTGRKAKDDKLLAINRMLKALTPPQEPALAA
jgi:hypothetical protein